MRLLGQARLFHPHDGLHFAYALVQGVTCTGYHGVGAALAVWLMQV